MYSACMDSLRKGRLGSQNNFEHHFDVAILEINTGFKMSSDFDNSDDELEEVINDLIEPQVILENQDQNCEESLNNQFQGQPREIHEGGGHFLFEESSSSTSNTIPKCVVCQARQPSRQHLANHFINELIEEIEDGQVDTCDKCQFQGSDAKSLVLHDVTEHDGVALDRILQDAALVSSKRAEVEARGHRQSLASLCPICDQNINKSHGRDHVSWHFLNELKEMIIDPNKCPECSYTGDKLEAVTRHLALFHCKLDEFLQDEQLVAMKRSQALSKPKKVILEKCPICDMKDPPREHVSRHFMSELMDLVTNLPDPMQCPECSYRGEKSAKNVARHMALVHSKLDVLLSNSELVTRRRLEHQSRPNKINIGSECPVCDQALTKQHSRVHVIWHFMDELREIVQTFEDSTRCDWCSYTNTSSDKVCKHIALGHSKLDEMLQNEELLQRKRALASIKPKRENLPICPICDAKDPTREHCARHFGDELNELVSDLITDQSLTCPECGYVGEKPKNLGLHIALVHGKLDEFIKDKCLVSKKRHQYLSQPKKQIIGPECPICGLTFTKSQNRDHVSWHFVEELRDFVKTFDNPQQCWKCDYQSEKLDNMVKHCALGHSKLDELLQDQDLVNEKRSKAMAKPRRISISTCPICDVKDPAREHVARHFSEELIAIVVTYPDPTACPECDYRGDKPKTLAIHVGLVHAKLDLMLSDMSLVQKKRADFIAKPKKVSIGRSCPVCDMKFNKSQNRDHVSWHYIEELRSIVQGFEDPNQCPQCPYTADSNEKMTKHVALGHSMLDALLQDENLLAHKRQVALSKPKKVQLGTCPICDTKDPTREHVARHFSDELNDIVLGFQDPTQCSQCSYKNERPKNIAIHIALVHSILDHFLSDKELVQSKRDSYTSKPQKINIGSTCPICDMEFAKSGQNRDHVCWHFIDELRDYVLSFPDTTSCTECTYSSDKLDNLVKHVALGHSKLDELLANEVLVNEKREQAMNKPKKIHIGRQCPICNMTFQKAQNRDHVSWHFMAEIREFVQSTGQDKSCTICYYTTEKMDNLVKHYALGHSKLDELLANEDLVKLKQKEYAKKPKRLSFGPDCPICQAKNKDRDHLSRHFMTELLEMVNEMPNRKQCNLCSYKSAKREYMAKHLALYHCKLDELMADENLVQILQKRAASKPKRVPMGDACIICGVGWPQREHVARHFIPELLEITTKFTNPLSCDFCPFVADKNDYVARHVGLVHGKLDEMVCDGDLVAKKVNEFNGQVLSHPTVKIEPVRKSSRQRQPVIKEECEVPDYILKRSIRDVKFEDTPNAKKIKLNEEPIEESITEEEAINEEVIEMQDDNDDSSNHSIANEILEIKEEPIDDDEGEDSDKGPMVAIEKVDIKEELFDEKDDNGSKRFTAIKPGPMVTIEKAKKKIDNAATTKEIRTPVVTIEKANKTSTPMGGVSLLKSSLLKDPRIPSLNSLLVPKKNSLNNKPGSSPTVTIEKAAMPTLPSSISLTPALPASSKVAELLQKQTPILPTKLDSASIADLNNSWAESLMSNSSYKKPKKPTDWGLRQPNELEQQKAIGSCTLTPATGKPVLKKSLVPTMTLSKIASAKFIAPSVTLTPADPHSRAKKMKFNFSPTATITPLSKGSSVLKPLFPSKPLEKAELPMVQDGFKLRGKPLNPEQVVVTPELLRDPEFDDMEDVMEEVDDQADQDLGHVDNNDDDDSDENMVLEPQIFFDDDDEENMEEPNDETTDTKDDDIDEFCDLCNMELEHHPDCQPCPLEEGFVREFSTCPVCHRDAPTKEHVARHFLSELRDIVETFEDPLCCNQCDYQSEKSADIVALHLALNHDALNPILEKVEQQQQKPMTKKVTLGATCPICEFKEPSREHVSRHFNNELLDYVATLDDHLKCSLCTYQGEKPQNLAKHMGLVHNMLDDLLLNSELVQKKRNEAMTKPKKISIGSTCPVCLQAIQKRDSRVHVIWHFMEELREMVQEFPEPTSCNYCPYTNPNPDKMAKHMALGHSKLDELLSDKDLVALKQQIALSKPKKLNIGPECPVCGIKFTKNQNRDHVSWHFMTELREYVQTFEDTQQCNQCDYRSDKVDNLVKHLALGHSKLDELLMNEELVAAKRELAKAKPQKVSIGPTCPICGIFFTKNQNRDHVSWHFMEELRAIVNSFDDPQVCNQCDYQTDKTDNLVKHLALGHSKLDEFLMDDALVAAKRKQYQSGRK